MKKVKSWQQYIGIGALILLLLVVFNFRSQLAHALVPFFLAVLVASIIEPMIGFFQKKLRLSRGSVPLSVCSSCFCSLPLSLR